MSYNKHESQNTVCLQKGITLAKCINIEKYWNYEMTYTKVKVKYNLCILIGQGHL